MPKLFLRRIVLPSILVILTKKFTLENLFISSFYLFPVFAGERPKEQGNFCGIL